MEQKTDIENAGVFELLTELCSQTASKFCTNSRISHKRLTSKMRSRAYESILRKSSVDLPRTMGDPIADLLSYYFVSQRCAKNTAEFKRSQELKRVISTIRQTDYGTNKEHIYVVLRLLIGLSNSVTEDLSSEVFQKPFSFGVLDEMLPKMPREPFGSPQPYSYFPSHVFELPYSLKRQDNTLNHQISQTYTEYTVESFDSKAYLVDTPNSQSPGHLELKTFLSPMSLVSMTSSQSPYSTSTMFNYPRLTAPRDLHIPGSEMLNVKSYQSTVVSQPELVHEVYCADSASERHVDIWELASQIDKDIPDDIWEIVAKMPLINERQLIATSSRELRLWRKVYKDEMSLLNIISEKQFIRNTMYLCIGIETNSFPYNTEMNCFIMKNNLVLEGISKENLRSYVADLLLVGTFYRRLYLFAFNQSLQDHCHTNGLVYEASREAIRRYLLSFRLKATEIYEECCKYDEDEINMMPTLLQILFHMEPLKYEIETVSSILKIVDADSKNTLPYGAELMSYLFNEISLVTHKDTAFAMFNALYSICKVYFKFIEKFIFEGELDDRSNEFFIRKDAQYVNCRSKRYWDKGFHITQSFAVPEFLRAIAKYILLCGKSLRLLKLCNPSDPLILLISSDHPSVKCCASFDELERQQQLLDVYRTRCLFVSGELVTFDQILLKKEAERKAFTEMATLKQAETMEKIVAERKRLAQLIIAEKQHSLRILEAAMAEAKAAKQRAKQRERKRCELEAAGDKATEEVDSIFRDVEKNKIMEYYSKLNIEVERKQIHTEWKIKRLQLDQSRMQLLSTEERNLKREKLELEHQRNEEMARSLSQSEVGNKEETSGDVPSDPMVDSQTYNPQMKLSTEPDKMAESIDSVTMLDVEEKHETEFDVNKKSSQSSSDVFSAICNVAKNFFGTSKSDKKLCDNVKQLDSQGNIIVAEDNSNESKSSNDVIGSHLSRLDNEQFLRIKQQALLNKQKVMAHEFGQYLDNNPNNLPSIKAASYDEENNVEEWSPFIEAKRNKLKVLAAEFGMKPDVPIVHEPKTDAQREAVINKQKVLGVEYNLPAEDWVSKEPANIAQEEAIRNKKRVLTSEYEIRCEQIAKECSQRQPPKRSGLTLSLKPYGEPYSNRTTPNIAVTPGELFSGLDLETPTTAEVPLEGAMSADIFTPRSEYKSMECDRKTEKDFLTTDGFNFPILDDTVDSENASDVQTEASPNNSPLKNLEIVEEKSQKKKSVFNLLDGSYSLEEFDPFGVKELKTFSTDHFTTKMDLGASSFCYTHPAVIMEEVKKRPYANIFTSHFDLDIEEEHKITCDNIATLTSCLQRSVMLPLTYQMEVVNNSILTYFLVDLDMYEHLKSLKDYFFLMDGEFSRSICHNLFTKLTKTLNPQELLNFATLHNILDKALGSSISHVHKFSENLSFTIADTPLSFQHSSPDVLQCLSLTYTVTWPLNIILSQEALLRYAKVFQFLLKMRRIFWVLGEDFQNLKLEAKLSKRHSRKLLKSQQYITIQLYRHVMASMIRALDNYIVTTCILTSWIEFENDLKKARTLDDLYECHVAYIKKVLFRCLLNNRSTPVMKLLNDIFTVILKFSRVLKAGEWQQKEPNGTFTHTSFAQLQELFHLFEKLAKYLHKVVTKLMECGYQRHLVELLTMVNLNGYYDPERSKDE